MQDSPLTSCLIACLESKSAKYPRKTKAIAAPARLYVVLPFTALHLSRNPVQRVSLGVVHIELPSCWQKPSIGERPMKKCQRPRSQPARQVYARAAGTPDCDQSGRGRPSHGLPEEGSRATVVQIRPRQRSNVQGAGHQDLPIWCPTRSIRLARRVRRAGLCQRAGGSGRFALSMPHRATL